MIQAVLAHEPYSSAFLLYGNRNKSSVIFGRELEALAQQYPERKKALL